MTNLKDIEGIGEKFALKLEKAGIKSLEQLLEDGKTPRGRKDLAEKSGLGEHQLLEWVNHADLFRIKGVASEYADLLEAAGVDTVPELALRNAESLVHKLETANAEKKLVRKLPTLSQVEAWIAEAKKLPRVITY